MSNTCHVKVMRSKWIMIMVILPYFSPSPAYKNLTTRLFKRKHRLKVSIYIQWPQMVNTKRFPITMLSYLMFMIHDFQFGQWTVYIWSKSNEDLFAGKAPTLVNRWTWRDLINIGLLIESTLWPSIRTINIIINIIVLIIKIPQYSWSLWIRSGEVGTCWERPCLQSPWLSNIGQCLNCSEK